MRFEKEISNMKLSQSWNWHCEPRAGPGLFISSSYVIEPHHLISSSEMLSANDRSPTYGDGPDLPYGEKKKLVVKEKYHFMEECCENQLSKQPLDQV